MKLNVTLSEMSIENAIRKLEDAIDDISNGISEVIDIFCMDGADIANQSYGSMATAWGQRDNVKDCKAEGHIGVSAKTEDVAIIAEFGAGYATMEYHPFAKNFERQTGIPIKVASFSKAQYPYGLFYITDDLRPGHGYWIWGWAKAKKGEVMGSPNFFDRVQARHGLLDAYDHLMQNGADIAKEVLRL